MMLRKEFFVSYSEVSARPSSLLAEDVSEGKSIFSFVETPLLRSLNFSNMFTRLLPEASTLQERDLLLSDLLSM
jgi:hypothetical protein